jgi:hypothetical protein
MYNEERQLGAMLTLETDRIFSKENSAKNVGHESYNTRNIGCEVFKVKHTHKKLKNDTV